MRSIEELNRLREQARADIRLRIEQPAVRIIIGSSTAAIAAGAREVSRAAIQEAAKHNLQVDIVHDSSVEDETQPVVVVEKGKEKVWYGGVDAAAMRQIITQHVLGNRVVSSYLLRK